ncbi:hypothetical protein N0V94_002988 [Neodidymelliopsis sp. IMI 364377]|nr:hypothetical protein N0V94_002988 [Neodidymelliopsis sp. IMI 364377]
MSRPPQRIKPTSDKKRERDVLQYVAAYRDLPFLDELGPEPDSYHLPATYQARPSSDSTLTALAQLAALRLNAQRALISLIDDKRQHVLAEATPRLPLRRTPSGDAHNPLWLGSVSIPRTWGVCEQVLGIDPGSSAQNPATTVMINKDLQDSKQHAHRTYVRDGPRVRFYAGAALVSPNGAVIGALCVFDSEPKPAGLLDDDIVYLEDLSATIVEYLGTYTVRDRFKRGEKLTRGLISFAEGASALLPLDDVDHLDTEDTSHSIMRELSRLDAVALNQQKTTFVASISHELRSPLHGILGTLEFIKDTPLDTFQTSMLNSLNACGQTLLDTINHVMDHSKMSETTKGVSSRRLKNTRTVRLSSKPLKTRRLRDPAFDLGIATEEVVEAVFAGSSFLPIVSSKNAPVSPTESTSTSAHTEMSDPTFKRKTCYIVLDIAPENDWIYCFPVGSWKRTVMNIFGNALKYTSTGHITVSLHATDVARSTGVATTITLIVTDTGTGMSPAFLANKAFQPFSQENPHSSGVGLGLSIVRQIIETNGGKIEVSSDHTSGTKLTVKLSLIRPETAQIALPQRNEYLSWLARLVGRKICIMHRVDSNQDIIDEPQNAEGLAKFSRALASTLTNHLKMEVVQTTKWESNNTDIVICPEPSFDYLASIRHKRANVKASKAAVTIFVALDALEASTLRSDVRVMNKESVVEIMTQPLGPYKLAYVLNKCLDRFEHPDENVQPVQNLTPSTKPNHTQSTYIEQQTSISPPPVEMPPLLNQPNWSETDIPPPSSSSDTSNVATPTIESTYSKELRLPIRPKLTIPNRTPNDSSNILITDDNVINRRLLVAFMKKYNLQYAEAENGLEALRAYQIAQVPYDVILMDMSMPVMDGMSATRAIRQYEQEYNVPRCCIIALTGLASASAKLEAWNSGIDHFMTKPVNFKALEKFLKKEEARREESTEAKREETTEAKREETTDARCGETTEAKS